MRAAAPILVLLALWQAVVSLSGAPAFILPPPLMVLEAAKDNAGLLAASAAVTGAEVVTGLILGALLGCSVAVFMVLAPSLGRFLRPILLLSQAVPVFALAPVLTLWLGYGIVPKIVVTVMIVFFPLASVFHDGLMATPEGLLDLSRLARAGRWQEFRRIRLPSALPSLGAGLTVAAVYAPIGAVTGEWVGASQGLGYVMLMANARSHADLTFAALIVLVALTLVLYAATRWIERWLRS
ncbi:ABC transporter permease [Solirhodobacter olei]|uniref:ABC transporter permease n=1 Tax=Solirhodobacter olei TaxID=2493082 RepID=UPI000FD8AB79|nr:ABC transporter permease [Solirhodobacter olei]